MSYFDPYHRPRYQPSPYARRMNYSHRYPNSALFDRLLPQWQEIALSSLEEFFRVFEQQLNQLARNPEERDFLLSLLESRRDELRTRGLIKASEQVVEQLRGNDYTDSEIFRQEIAIIEPPPQVIAPPVSHAAPMLPAETIARLSVQEQEVLDEALRVLPEIVKQQVERGEI